MKNKKIFTGEWSADMATSDNGQSFWGLKFAEFCEQALVNENLYSTFKVNPLYNSIVISNLNDPQLIPQWWGRITNPKLIDLIPKFIEGDKIGNPPTFQIKEGEIAGNTVLHIFLLQDMLKQFGDITGFKVVEIGPGYGGQAKMLLDYGVDHYTLIDLKPNNEIQRKYLTQLGYTNTTFYNTENIEEDEYDLVISNACLSEFDKQGIQFYVDTVISKCKNGYFFMNIWDEDRKNFILDLMKQHFTTVETYLEDPKTHVKDNWFLIVKK